MGSSTLQRRLASEWHLLTSLAAANPARIDDLAADDLTLHCTLRGTPARLITGELRTVHALRIAFPNTFPAAPMELSLRAPVEHPNIHPTTGFVCLWNEHRASHTSEIALLKTAAILGARLWNSRPEHVMQPAALQRFQASSAALASEFQAPPLVAVTAFQLRDQVVPSARRRLS